MKKNYNKPSAQLKRRRRNRNLLVASVLGVAIVGLCTLTSQPKRAEATVTKSVQVQAKHELSLKECLAQRQNQQIVHFVDNSGELSAYYAAIKSLDAAADPTTTKMAIYYAVKYAPEFKLDPTTVLAIGMQESTFTHLVSRTKDYGPMGINAATWGNKLGVSSTELLDIETNIIVGCKILQLCRDEFGFGESRYVGAYHAPNNREAASAYQTKVLAHKSKLQKKLATLWTRRSAS